MTADRFDWWNIAMAFLLLYAGSGAPGWPRRRKRGT
jgi:hypothetical protein